MTWSKVPLSELVPPDDKINYGVVQPGPNVPGGVPLVRVGDLFGEEIDLDALKRIGPEVERAYARSRLRGDEVLLACVGSIGEVMLSTPSLAGANIARAIARIRCGSRLERRFLAHYLRSPRPQEYFQTQTRAVAQPTLNIKQIELLPVPLPPLPEQKRIAAILDKADAIKRKRQEAIRLTEELLRAAFLEMFGDPVTNPKGWEVRPLGELTDIGSGVTKGKAYTNAKMVDVPYMRVANVQDGHLRIDDVTSITVSEEDAARYQLLSGDLLLTEGGDPDKLGRGAVWYGQVPSCIHQNHIFRVRSLGSALPEFLSAQIASRRGKAYFLKAAKQTTGIATINMTQLRAFPTLVPPLPLQCRFVDVARRITSSIERIQGTASITTQMCGALASDAFSGRL